MVAVAAAARAAVAILQAELAHSPQESIVTKAETVRQLQEVTAMITIAIITICVTPSFLGSNYSYFYCLPLLPR